METPTPATPAGRNRSSSVPTDTDCSSVFDTNSPTSTSISPRSDAGHKLVATEETTSQDQLAPAVCSDDAGESTTIMFPSVFYGSANLQPPSRDRRAPAIFAGFISNIPPLSDEELRHVELSPASKNELTPAPTDDEEETTASQPKSSKSKKPASSSSSSTKSTPKPKAKITKKPLTKRTTKKTSRPTALTPVTSFENAQPSPPASQLGKRKLAATALGITPSKKPKQTPSTSGSQQEPQHSPTTVENGLDPSPYITRIITKSRKPALSQGTVPSEASVSEVARAAAAPAEKSPILKLKISAASWSDSKFAQQLEVLQGAETASAGLDSALLPPSPPIAENTIMSFDSTVDVPSQNDPEQCAQTTPAPIAVSSQGGNSFDGSQTAQTMSLQHEWRAATPGLQAASTELDLDSISSLKLDTSPGLPRYEQEHSLQALLHGSTEAGLPPSPFDLIDPPTQPTQPWCPPPALPFPDADHESDADSETTPDEVEESNSAQVCTELSDEKQQLRDIVERLLANRHPGAVKFAPAGQPAVWAEGRQELCETLHYFRSYQSACHSTGGFVRGFMFDNNAHVRDYIDNDVVISRAGGGMVKDKDSGEMKAGRDQSDDSSTVKALRNCMKQYNPVVVIVGTDNPHVPSKPPHQYCVLDYFKPTHIWVEKSGKGKILRYRFEKLNSKKESWWRPENEEESVELGSLGLPVEKTCDACTEKSPQIYLNGWMCLKPNCTTFWHILDESVPYEPNEASLMYDPRFLKQKTPWPNDDSEYPLAFNSAELSGYSIPGEDTSQAFWSGMVCPQCGRCNSRLSWTGWHCECGYRRDPPHALIPAASLRDPLWPLTSSYTMSKDILAPLIDVNVSFAHGYRINRYTIPGIEGFITHMIANQAILEEPGGPDDMFEELQQTDIGLERRSMPSGQLKGDKYCRHFAVNYGMPYKFIAATASHSFDGAARPVTATRSRLNWAAQLLMSQETGTSMDEVRTTWKEKEFNEVLALGYFESQKMNYHDDGEYGLGPTIATLSLGAPGTMRIRMKARNYNGSSTAGVYDDSRPIPGCTQFEARAELHASLQSLKASNPSAFRARLKQVPKDLKLKGSGNSKEVLKMELGHGDVVVMHGAEIQKYYEHAVEHAGKLRFALTCRYIDGGSLKEGDRPGYVVGADEGGYDGARVC